MKATIATACVTLALLLAVPATATAKDYSLASGTVQFSAPDNWPAIMHMTSGEHQFYAFQVPNPNAEGTLTTVRVSTHHLANNDDFPAFVTQTMNKANKSDGFSKAEGELAAAHSLHYRFTEDSRPQSVRLSVFQYGHQAVVLRCQRPQNANTTKSWLSAYRSHCSDLARQLGH